MKVTLTKIFIDDEIKNGKYGPIQKVGIKIDEPEVELEDGSKVIVGDRWIYGFLNKVIKGWNKGDIVDIFISERDSGGKSYLNFKLKKEDNDRIAKLEEQVKKLNDSVFAGRNEEITVDDVDFN